MASLQERDGRWQCQFLHRGKRRTFALGRVTEAEAKAKSDQVDYLLMRLGQGLITMPPGADIVAFVRHDGSIPTSAGEAPCDSTTLASLRDRYLETHGNGTLEAHTLRGIILYAAISETFSNCWKLRVIKVFSGSAWVVGRPWRVSSMAARNSANVGW